MSADVYATVAEAYEGGRYEWQHEFGGTADLWGARAAVDALAGMGDVTDEQIVESFAGVAHLPTGFNEHATAAVRALIAQARATDQARIALLDVEVGRMEARAEVAEATVERVRALCDRAEASERRTRVFTSLAYQDVRQTIDGEVVPGPDGKPITVYPGVFPGAALADGGEQDGNATS
jgi:hypothetical protein